MWKATETGTRKLLEDMTAVIFLAEVKEEFFFPVSLNFFNEQSGPLRFSEPKLKDFERSQA